MKKSILIGVIVMSVLAALFASCKKKEPPGTELSFSSFDGGGPYYDIFIEDEDIVSVGSERRYRDKNHEELDGAGYDVVFTFRGLKPGTTYAQITARSPIGDNWDARYEITVGADLTVTTRELTRTDYNEIDVDPVPYVCMRVGEEYFFSVSLEKNPSADAFFERLDREPLNVVLKDDRTGRRIGEIPWDGLPEEDEAGKASPKDLLLIDGNLLAVCCDEYAGLFTKIGRIEFSSDEEFAQAFANGDAEIEMFIEWTE